MIEIRLPEGTWYYDPDSPLGTAGAFGKVFEGVDSLGGPVAVKKLHVHAENPGHREILVGKSLAGRDLRYVVPVYGAGQDQEGGSLFVVMAKAERSLLDDVNGDVRCTDTETAKILLDILAGLLEVPDLVHRDLKPGNVLYHDGRWKLADFGIALFVEAATSAQTLRGWLSEEYAAPEQWERRRATHRTDVYALGCIAHALISGKPPFRGKKEGELREKHLYGTPPTLQGVVPWFQSIVDMMLGKPPSNRPGLAECKRRLEEFRTGPDSATLGPGLAELTQANAKVARENLTRDAELARSQAQEKDREDKKDAALVILHRSVDRLIADILTAAPLAKDQSDATFALVILGSADMSIDFRQDQARAIPSGVFSESGWDVIMVARIACNQENPRYEWSANLVYTDQGDGDEYGWVEVAFHAPLKTHPPALEPFCLAELDQMDKALAKSQLGYSLAAAPRRIDDEHTTDFIDRWSGILAAAQAGRLKKPSRLPVPYLSAETI